MKYLDLVLWIILCLTEGWSEAAAFSWTDKDARKPEGWNVHRHFIPDRGAKLLAVLLVSFLTGTHPGFLPFIAAAFILMFSFLHNGMYYTFRGKQDVPGYNWWSESTTTTARYSFDIATRSYLFLIGLITYGVMQFLEWGVLEWVPNNVVIP